MHALWSKVFGYNVHPKIPTGRPDLRVADVGTGTGLVQSSPAGIPRPTSSFTET